MGNYTIKQLDQMPKVKEKAQPKSNLRMLIDQFDAENMDIAEIQIPEGKAHGVLIGIGRVLANQNHRKDIEYFERSDGKSVVLRRVKQISKAKPIEKKS